MARQKSAPRICHRPVGTAIAAPVRHLFRKQPHLTKLLGEVTGVGVEMAGTLTQNARHTLPGEFCHIDPASAKIILLEGGPRVLQATPGQLVGGWHA